MQNSDLNPLELEKVFLFSGLSSEELKKIAALFSERLYERGQLIIDYEESALELFFITSGMVRVYRLNESGALIILALLGRGDFFGEMALFTDSNRTAYIEAVTDVKVFVLHKEDFKDLLIASPSLAWQMLGILSQRLVKMDEKMENLVCLNVEERLIRALAILAKEFGEDDDEYWILPKYITHLLLGELIGTSRETVTRVLGRLEEKGYLKRIDAQSKGRTGKEIRIVLPKKGSINY